MNTKMSIVIRFIVVIVFVLAIAFQWRVYSLEKDTTNKAVLRYQLQLLREGVSLYKLINKKYPESLITLMVDTYQFPDSKEKRTYVFGSLPVTSDGKVIDPFGNPYAYDKGKGWISSTTTESKNW